MPPSDIDCTTCGACCFGPHDRYIAILPQDAHRPIPAEALTEIDGRRYLRMADGHCAQLFRDAAGRLVCAIYETRPEACRAFRAGSFECGRTRHHRLSLAMATGHPAPMPPNAVSEPTEKGPKADMPPAHVVASLPKGRMKPPA